MASKRQKGWAFVDNKDWKRNKKSKNRKRQKRNDEFEIINGTSSSDEQQFEVIPTTQVRILDTQPLKVNEDYYAQARSSSSNVEDTDSDIEVISNNPSSKLYNEVLRKSALSTQKQTTHHDNLSQFDSDDIESGEDVLAMELDSLLKEEQEGKNNLKGKDHDLKPHSDGNDDEDFGIEVIDEGTAIDLELLKMEKSGFFIETKVQKEDHVQEEKCGEITKDVIVSKEETINNLFHEVDENSEATSNEVNNEIENEIEQKESSDNEADMTMSSFGLAALFETTYEDEEEKNNIMTIKTTTLVLLLCVSITAGMSVGTGIGSLIAIETDQNFNDQHRNSLAKPEEHHFFADDVVIQEDGEFKATEKTIKEIQAAFRVLEVKYNDLKDGYDDYKRRYNLHKHMMWYWKKRAKKYESTQNYAIEPDSMIHLFEGRKENETDETVLTKLTISLKEEKKNVEYWRKKYTSLKLSKIRTCANIGKKIPARFSFSNCLVLLSNAMPDLHISTNIANLTNPVERISNHVNKAWNSLKNKWKSDVTLKDSAAIKKSLNVKRFRKMFSYGNIVADDYLKTNRAVTKQETCSNARFEEFTNRWRKPVTSFPKPENGKNEECFNLRTDRGEKFTEDCLNEYIPRPSNKLDLVKERGLGREEYRGFLGISYQTPCEEKESVHVYIRDQDKPCKKKKIDLVKERGTECDKDCITDTSKEEILRTEKKKLQKKLSETIALFQLFKLKAKIRLQELKSEMKKKLEMSKNRRHKRVIALKKQKQELKAKIRELTVSEEKKHEDELKDLEKINDRLKLKINGLKREKRYWERIEKYNLKQKIEELKELMENQQRKYENQVKSLKKKFRNYAKKQRKQHSNKKMSRGRQEEKIHMLQLEKSRMENKLNYYKKKERLSRVKIEQLQLIVDNAKETVKRKSKRVKKPKRKPVKSVEKPLHWKSYDDELNDLNLPLLPSVYCPDQMNCMKKDEGPHTETDEIIEYKTPGIFAMKPFQTDEDVLFLSPPKLCPPLNLTPSFFPPKPEPSKLRKPAKPKPPQRLRDLEKEIHISRLYASADSKGVDESTDNLYMDQLQTWFIGRADERANQRQENNAIDENMEKDWYLSMMTLREEYREEIRQQDLNKEIKLNWYIRSLMNKDEERANLYTKMYRRY